MAEETSLASVAKFLLKNQYLLTGLELLQECTEKQTPGSEIPAELRDFFSPANLDKLNLEDDVAAIAATLPSTSSQKPKSPEEQGRVALLEYELRQERHSLQTLRQELGAMIALNDAKVKQAANPAALRSVTETPTERRILNYLVKRYLSANGYHRTSVALASEAESDADSWTSATRIYGGGVAEPPALIYLYRYFYGMVSNKDSVDKVYETMEKLLAENSRLKDKLEAKEKQVQQMTAMEETVELLRAELSEANNKLRKEREQLLVVQSSLKEESLRNQQISQMVANLPQLPPGEVPATLAQVGQPQGDGALKPSASSSNINVNGPAQSAQPEENKEKPSLDAKMTPLMPEAELLRRQRDPNDPLYKKRRNFQYLFRREDRMDESAIRISSEVLKLKTLSNSNTSVVSILASSLPHVMSAVILAKRQELIPLLLACVCWHPDPKKRFELTSTLFNLVKVPNEQQRKIIIDGLIYLAELAGSERTGNEVLPQAMEQISNKFDERRILVADACGWLAPYVKPELRLSLLLSILHSLTADKAASVRSAAATNIARIIHLEDDPQAVDLKKFQQLADIVFTLLQDSDNSVSTTTKTTLLPVFTDFGERMKYFQQRFLPILPYKMYQLIEKSPLTIDTKSVREIDLLAQIVTYLIPQMFESSLCHLPFYKDVANHFEKLPPSPPSSGESRFVSMFTDQEKKQLKQKFDEFIPTFERKKKPGEATTPASPGPAAPAYNPDSTFEWVIYDLVPMLFRMLEKADLSNKDTADGLAHIIKVLAVEFGAPFTRKIIEPYFKTLIHRHAKSQKPDAFLRRARLAVAYASSLLINFEAGELKNFVKSLIVDVSMKQNSWTQIKFPVLQDMILSINRRIERIEVVLEILTDLLAHPESKVRRNVAKLFDSLVALTNATLISTKVLPALITLSSDTDLNVKRMSVRGFGNLLTVTEDKQIVEKINLILNQFIEEQPKFKVCLEAIQTFAMIAPRVPQSYRDAFIVKKLVSLAKFASEFDEDSKKQKELAESLYKAFRSLYGSTIPREVVKESLLPGLKYLSKIIELAGIEVKAQLTQMITTLESITRDSPALPPAAAPPKERDFGCCEQLLKGGSAKCGCSKYLNSDPKQLGPCSQAGCGHPALNHKHVPSTPSTTAATDMTGATQAFMNIFNYQNWQIPTWNLATMGAQGTPGAPAPAAGTPTASAPAKALL